MRGVRGFPSEPMHDETTGGVQAAVQPRSIPSSLRTTVAGLIGLAIALPPAAFAQFSTQTSSPPSRWPQGTLPVGELGLSFDSTEGKGRDIAVPRDGTSDPGSKRVYTAAGRKRWQHDLDTMERMVAEEREFAEELNSIELSSDDTTLFTASYTALFREDVSLGPATPATPQHAWQLPDPENDRIMDVKLLPSPDHDRGIFVLAQFDLYVLSFDDQAGEFVLEGQVPLPSGLVIQTNFEIHQNIAGEWRAYVMGPLIAPDQSKSRGIAVCSLGDPLGDPPDYTMQFIGGTDGNVWIPTLNESGQSVYDSGCYNIALRNEGGTTRAYVAAGFDRQVTVLDVMAGGEDPGQWTHELDPLVPAQTVLDRIVLDTTTSSSDGAYGITWNHDQTYLHVVDKNDFWTVDPANGAGFPKQLSGLQFGFAGFQLEACAFGPAPDTQSHVWSLTQGEATHVLKRFTLGPAGEPQTAGEVYGMFASDGAVAIPDPQAPENTVIFTPTFGGVIKFSTTDATEPQTFTVEVDSYQPAQPAASTFSHVTEQIAIGNIAGDLQPADWHVFTTSAKGQFLDFPVDGNLDLQVPELRQPPISEYPWTVGDQIYGTSIEFVDLDEDGKWVLYDLANQTRGEIMLIACRVDVSPVQWKFARADDDAYLNKGTIDWALNVTENWAVIAFEDGIKTLGNGKYGGFVLFDLRDLAGPTFETQTPAYAFIDPFDKCGGVAMNAAEDLILASCATHEETQVPGNRNAGGVHLFSVDTSTTPPTLTRIAQMNEPADPLLEGTDADDFRYPNMSYFDTGYRCRWFRNNGIDTWSVVQYVGGYVYQFSYDPTRPKPLDLDAVWHGRDELDGEEWQGYKGEGQDVRIYDFGYGQRILNAQNSETFVILEPF